MTMKPFEIQSTTLSIGGTRIDVSANGNLVLPGVTRAATSVAIEVQDTQDQNRTWGSTPQVIDGYTYEVNVNGYQPQIDWSAATYAVDQLDGDGFIDGISVVDGGANYTGEAVTYSQTMYASEDGSTWYEIPFMVRCGAGEIESVFGSGGGGVTVGEIDSQDQLTNDTTVTAIGFSQADGFSVTELDGGIMKINFSGGGGGGGTGDIMFNGTSVYANDNIDIYTNSETYAEVWLRDNYDVLITADGEQTYWRFQAGGNLVFPDGTVQQTAYAGGGGGGSGTLYKARAKSSVGFSVVGYNESEDTLTMSGDLTGVFYQNDIVWADAVPFVTNNFMAIDSLEYDSGNDQTIIYLAYNIHGVNYTNSKLYTVVDTDNFTTILQGDNTTFDFDPVNHTLKINATGGAAGLGNLFVDGSTILSNDAPTYVNLNGEGNLNLGVNGNGGVVKISATGGASNWIFDTNDQLTFPDGTVQTTAYTGQTGGGAGYSNFIVADGGEDNPWNLSDGDVNSAVQIWNADINLPQNSNIGDRLVFTNQGSSNPSQTIYTFESAGTIFHGNFFENSSITLNSGETLEITSRGTGEWDITGGSVVNRLLGVQLGNLNVDGSNVTSSENYVNLTTGSTSGYYANLVTGIGMGSSYAELYSENDNDLSNQTYAWINTKTDMSGSQAFVEVQNSNDGNTYRWTFSQDGHLVFPDNTVQTTAYTGGAGGGSGSSISSSLWTFSVNDSGQLYLNYDGGNHSLWMARDNEMLLDSLSGNVVLCANDDIEWNFSTDSTLILPSALDPSGNRTRKSIKGSVETIHGDPWPHNAAINNGDPELIWTASAEDIIGARMTLRFQSEGYMEMVDVMMAKETNHANVSFSVSNRVKTNDMIDDAYISVGLDGSNRLVVTASAFNNGYWTPVTYSVTEFKRTYD